MRKMNKKGFTIVELVIVIAVIAILAAVLIPTFVSLVNKANVANDTAVAKNINNALAQYSATNGAPENFDEVLAAIEEAGYVLANLNAKADGNLYGWDKTNNQIVYIDAEGEVIYQNTDFVKEDLQFIIADGNVTVPEGFGSTVVDMTKPEGPKAFAQAIASGVKEIKIDTDMTLSSTTTVPGDTSITIDLGGKTLTTNERDSVSHHYALDVHGTVTFTNGTVNARGVQVYDEGKIIVGQNAKINAVDNNGGACLWVYEGADVLIDGGVFTALNGDCDDVNDAAGAREPGIINNSGKAQIKGGEFTAVSNCYAINNTGDLIIDGGNFTASRGVVAATAGTVTINGGTFVTTDGATAYVVYAAGDANIVINAGTFTAGGSYVFCVDSGSTNAKITVKAGVIVNGEALSEDLVLTAGMNH